MTAKCSCINYGATLSGSWSRHRVIFSKLLWEPANQVRWASPHLPWAMQRICGPFVLKTIIIVSRDSLSYDTRLLDLCILFKFIFSYLWYIPPHCCAFHTFYFHQFFLAYITTRNIFPIPDDAVARNLIIIFNFRSQRPHLNYSFLSNVYSFATMEFSKKHKC